MVDWLRRKPNASGDAVRADHGGFAAGRDIRDNKFGLDEEETGRRIAEAQEPLVAHLAALADQVARDKGVATAPLLAILAKLGERGVPNLEIPARLDALADQLIELRGQLGRLRNDRPEVAVIREQALALIDHGDLDAARAALSRGREAARALREETSRNEAEFLADEARIDHLQLAYRDAAQKYAEAAALIVPFDPNGQWQYVLRQADELNDQGYEFGDNQALMEAIAVYQQALTLASRQSRPLEWAQTQNNLGNALHILGRRESGTARLEESVSALRDALRERTRQRVPLEWAQTQNNLGLALGLLGERESGTARLKESVSALRDALKERTRQLVPLEWAGTQNNLGNVLQILGERDGGRVRLKRSVAAFRDALREYTRERIPLQWATTQNNLGNSLRTLGERESGTVRLEEAVAAFRDALTVYTRARVPLQWAGTQNNLGRALVTLGGRESGTERLEEAVAAYCDALTEYTRERVPRDWALTQNNLGNALRRLGERESGTVRLEEAVAAYRAALMELTRERVPLDWAASFGNQGFALMRLAERTNDASMAQTAVLQIQAAFETFRDGGHVPFAVDCERRLTEARRIRDALKP